MWLLFLPILLHSLEIWAIPVFTFNGTSESSATPSFASLVNDVELPDIFILCSSSKQAKFDDLGVYSIAGKDSGVWLSIKMYTFLKATKLALRWDGKFYNIGELKNPKLDYWYHVCMRMDLSKNEIEGAVNGVMMGRVVGKNITNIPSKLKMKIGIDYKNRQFQGSVANIQIFKDGNVTDISAMPCKHRHNTILCHFTLYCLT